MPAPQQWLIVPADPEKPAYLSTNKDVVTRRLKKGDVVEVIERAPGPPPTDKDEEL